MSEQIEATLDALQSKLTSDLPAKLTAINAEATDGWTLDGPTLIAIGVKDTHDYPTVFILPEATETETDRAGGVVWRHRIRVVSFLAEWDEEGLMRKVIRFQRAVREVCLSNRDPGAGGFGIIHDSDDYGPVFQPTEDGQAQAQFVQGAATIFVVRQIQDIA